LKTARALSFASPDKLTLGSRSVQLALADGSRGDGLSIEVRDNGTGHALSRCASGQRNSVVPARLARTRELAGG
jgi:hypothetical protein